MCSGVWLKGIGCYQLLSNWKLIKDVHVLIAVDKGYSRFLIRFEELNYFYSQMGCFFVFLVLLLVTFSLMWVFCGL